MVRRGQLLVMGGDECYPAADVAAGSLPIINTAYYSRTPEELLGRVNGTFDTMGHTAIRYLHHGYPFEEMVALYLATDVMLVTSLRDGMNLVAKEYVAAQVDDEGVLVPGPPGQPCHVHADQGASHDRQLPIGVAVGALLGMQPIPSGHGHLPILRVGLLPGGRGRRPGG